MKQFYRLENDEGKGIYRDGSEVSVMAARFSQGKNTRHPGPGDDSKLVEACEGTDMFKEYEYTFFSVPDSKYFSAPDYIFGFENVAQFRAWFYDDKLLKFAGKNGIKLNLYESNDCFAGNTQMVANKKSLILIGECDILTGEIKEIAAE